VHIEGTLEPELAFALARRNGVALHADEGALKAAYAFDGLQSFLDLYYACAAVLLTRADFRDLMLAYLQRAAADGVIHAEIFFDPQTHTARGVRWPTVLDGLEDGLAKGWRVMGFPVG
jgi:adenosine deaminase